MTSERISLDPSLQEGTHVLLWNRSAQAGLLHHNLRLPGVPATRAPKDFHLLVTSRFAFAPRLSAPLRALRAMPGARRGTGLRDAAPNLPA